MGDSSASTAFSLAASPGRLVWLDGLRGAAVLGILPLNARWLLWNQEAYVDPAAFPDPLAGFAFAWWLFCELFLDHTTLALFAFIFGVSLALAAAGRSPGARAAALAGRLAALAVFGVVNTLVWPGDILLPYVLSAVVIAVVVVVDSRPTVGVVLFGCLWLVLGLAARIAALVMWEPGDGLGVLYRFDPLVYAGPLADSIPVRLAALRTELVFAFPTVGFPLLVPLMLFGVVHAVNPQALRLPPVGVASMLALVLGLSGLAVAHLHDYRIFAVLVAEQLGFVAGFFWAVAAWGLSRSARRFWATPVGMALAGCGRASLTIYLVQVVLLAAVAQGWGLGLQDILPHAQGLAVVFAVLMVSVALGTVTMDAAWRLPCEAFVRRVERFVLRFA